MDLNQIVIEQMSQFNSVKLITVDMIPDIYLYMEQVTSFIDSNTDERLKDGDQRVFTKTMINNYTKAGILERPIAKRYGKDHIVRLLEIFLLKHLMSVQEIFQIFSIVGEAHSVVYKCFCDTYISLVNDREQNLATQMEIIDIKMQENNIVGEGEKFLIISLMIAMKAISGKVMIEKLMNDQMLKQKAFEPEDKKSKRLSRSN